MLLGKQAKCSYVLGSGFSIFLTLNICDPKLYFSMNVIFHKEKVAWIREFPLEDRNIYWKKVK